MNHLIRTTILPFASVALFACSSSDAATADNAPPTLKILSLVSPLSDVEKDGGSVSLDCGRVVNLNLGPSENAIGQLDHWDLRPPGNCSDEEQACGFVRVDFVPKSGEGFSYTTLLLNSTVRVPEGVADGALRVTLVQANSGKEHLVNEKPVRDIWTVTFVDGCSDGQGGAGGAGGAGS